MRHSLKGPRAERRRVARGGGLRGGLYSKIRWIVGWVGETKMETESADEESLAVRAS